MRSLNLLSITTLLALGSTLAEVTSEFAFSTNDAFVGKTHSRKQLRRTRRAAAVADDVPSENVNVKHAASKTSGLEQEDKHFWKRLLDEDMSMNTKAPTDAPATGPTDAPVTAPTTENPPSSCPVEVRTVYCACIIPVFQSSCFDH